MEEHPLSLYELNALVKRSIHACLPDTYWVQAELSDVRSNYSGHCYLEFVQKEPRGNNLIAKARGTIWSNVYRLLKPYFEEETWQAFAAAHPELNTELNQQAWQQTAPLFAGNPAALDKARYEAYEQFLYNNKLVKKITPLTHYAVELH